MPEFVQNLRWSRQAVEVCAAANPLNAVLRRAVDEPSKGRHREAELSRLAPRRASPTVQWADSVAQGASQGRRIALTYGLGAALPLGLVLSPQLRASAYACTVATAFAGTGATNWAQDTVLPHSRVGRAVTGFVGYGLLGAVWGAARGAPQAPGEAAAATKQAPPRDRKSWVTIVDATLVGLTVCLHGFQLLASIYPVILVTSVLLAAGVVGSVLGGLVGAVQGYSVVMRRPGTCRAGEGAPAGGPPPAPPATQSTPTDATTAPPSPTPAASPKDASPSEAPSAASPSAASPELADPAGLPVATPTQLSDAASHADSEASEDEVVSPNGRTSTFYDAPEDPFDKDFQRAAGIRTDSDELELR